MTHEEVSDCLSKGANKRNESTITNFVTVMKYDDNLRDGFGLNRLTGKIETKREMIWQSGPGPFEDGDLHHLKYYMEYFYNMNNEKDLLTALSVVADSQSFHPIAELLESLEWDGTDRLSEAMTVYLGAEKSPINTEFLTVFMLGAINRVFHPGCKFEMMLNLTGPQGVGKSSFVRFLAMKDEWFCDDVSSLSDELICRRLMGHWIIELPELVATANSKSIEATKAQISRQKDTYKIPYDRFAKDFPRRCVFAGTTNRREFLAPDKSGNRRYLPVACDPQRQEKMILDNEEESRAYFRQLWAQAMHIYETDNPPLKLSAETEKYLREYQADFTPEDYEEGLIESWFEQTDYDRVCTLMIYNECLGRPDKPPQYILNEISAKVDSMIESGRITGFEKSGKAMKTGKYGVQRGWKRSDLSGQAQYELPVFS